jgi:predicted RNA polymerase sigma factor
LPTLRSLRHPAPFPLSAPSSPSRRLPTYHLFHATRAEALRRAGHDDEAAAALRRAVALTSNAAERRHLERELVGFRNAS